MARYARILARFCKNSLLREMSFRGHFIVNVASEILWVGLLLIFVEVIFSKTPHVRGWTEAHYLFLLGTHMIITSIFETFFFGNCWRISQLVRTGNLDFVLVRPASTQFLLSFERIDYSALANVPVGIALCIYAAWDAAANVTTAKTILFIILLLAGVTILYSLLYIFAITSVWLIRHTGINHLWFYAVSLARYPHDIYKRFVGGVMWFALVFVIPILMVTNLPASVMVKTFHPLMVLYIVAASVFFLALSMLTSRFALRWYRSASS